MAAASVDDVGAAAGRASAKSAGVVVDDTAVTPQYVQRDGRQRELPMIRKIAVGSLRNKILFILPAALLLSQFLPWLLAPILMLGGHLPLLRGRREGVGAAHGHEEHELAAEVGPEAEDGMVSSAIRGLHPVGRDPGDRPQRGRRRACRPRAGDPARDVAVGITGLVYGVVVGMIVKMDDIGSCTWPSAARPFAGNGSASAWSARCHGLLSVISRAWASPRCCGSAGTSCWSTAPRSGGTGPTTPCTTGRRTSTTRSRASDRGARLAPQHRRVRGRSGWSGVRSWSPSMHVLPFRKKKCRAPHRGAGGHETRPRGRVEDSSVASAPS